MIDILLATYNGEKFIREQIDSIINQTYTDWILHIKDDCSTDNTYKIISEYSKGYKEKIKVYKSEKPTGSAKANFFSMLKLAKNDYVMFCDQDDVWLEDKIETTISVMKDAEIKFESSMPILVHTDLEVVDSNLNTINKSLLDMQILDSSRDKLNNLLVQNIVTGCTMMVNRVLLDYIKQIPDNAVMHDWWMALIASAFGKIVFINKDTVLYRQHQDNQVGAKNVNSLNYIRNKIIKLSFIKRIINDTYLQADCFLQLYNTDLSIKDKNLIYMYSNMVNYNKIRRISKLFKYDFWKYGLIRKLGQIIIC